MSGRGAWPNSGASGTKAFRDASKSGPYYFVGSGAHPGHTRTLNERAVYLAVKAYQRALNRRINSNLHIDGVFSSVMAELVKDFQVLHSDLTVWGGIGPSTSKELLRPDIAQFLPDVTSPKITLAIVSGTINHESMWDAGAVGSIDDNDLGLAQINGLAHPGYTVNERFQPGNAFGFIVEYYENALDLLDDNIRDAIAAYNLGIGGANRWISQGRPDWYTPAGSSKPRNVKYYIDTILAG